MIKIGSGVGTWYLTNDDLSYPVDPDIQIAFGIGASISNIPDNADKINELLAAMNPGTGTEAFGVWEIAAGDAAIGSYTACQIDSVTQAALPITITTNDELTTAQEIATAVDVFTPVTGPNYKTVVQPTTTGGARVLFYTNEFSDDYEGDVVSLTGSVGNVGTATNVQGGRDPGQYRFRMLYDTGVNTFSTSAFPVTAQDFSDAMVKRTITDVAPEDSATIVTNTLEISRKGSDFTVLVTGDPSNPDLTTIVYPDAQVGDRVTLKPDGANVPFRLVNNVINVIGRDMQFEDVEDAITLRVQQQNPLILQQVSRTDQVFTQRSDEIERVVPNPSGTFNIIPNETGTPPALTTYRNNVTITSPQTLTANYNFLIDTSNMRNGDAGIISGNGFSIDPDGNTLSVQSGLVIRQIDDDLALTGQWKALWSFDGTDIQIEIVPDFSSSNTGFIPPSKWSGNSNRREIVVSVSFEAGEQAQYPVKFASDCNILEIVGTTTRQIAATDNAVVDIQVSAVSVATITYAPNEVINSQVTATPVTSYPIPVTGGNTIFFETSKVTPGGKALVYVILELT